MQNLQLWEWGHLAVCQVVLALLKVCGLRRNKMQTSQNTIYMYLFQRAESTISGLLTLYFIFFIYIKIYWKKSNCWKRGIIHHHKSSCRYLHDSHMSELIWVKVQLKIFCYSEKRCDGLLHSIFCNGTNANAVYLSQKHIKSHQIC